MTDLGDLNPRYWYVDNAGNIKKTIYCSLCLAGPFKESEAKKNFFQRGKSSFCMKCATHHKFFNDPQGPSGIDTVNAPKVRDILSEDLPKDELSDF